MKNLVVRLGAVVLVASSLMLVACSAGQITTSLKLIVDTAEIAIPILGAADPGIPLIIIADAGTYLNAVNEAIIKSGPILDSDESAALKSSNIAALFSGLAEANLPPGTPQVILEAISKVSAAVVSFLSNVSVKASSSSKMLTLTHVKTKVSSGDRDLINRSIEKAHKNLERIRNIRR